MSEHSRSIVVNSALRPDGRVLSRTEQQFFAYCDSEAQAIAFAKLIPELPEDADFEYIQNVVVLILLEAKEAADGEPARVEFIGGHRRDTLRLQ